MWTDRTEILIGKDGIEKLAKAHVAVIGLGGVGGYAAYMLARAGIGEISIVDFDKVDETNINRQIVADTTTIGKNKTAVMQEIISKINPNCKINAMNQKVCAENLGSLKIENCNCVVDAIDSVKDKVDLICFCKQHNINIISAMGAGNRICMPQFVVTDIFKTSHDGLAKVLRKQLRQRGISSLDVVTSIAKPLETDTRKVGSIPYFPAMCGCVIAAHVVNKLIE